MPTFLINHFDLFGLLQVWLQLLGKAYTRLRFGTPGPYRFVAGEGAAARNRRTHRVPGAQFVELPGKNHILLEDEPGWPKFQEAMVFARDHGFRG